MHCNPVKRGLGRGAQRVEMEQLQDICLPRSGFGKGQLSGVAGEDSVFRLTVPLIRKPRMSGHRRDLKPATHGTPDGVDSVCAKLAQKRVIPIMAIPTEIQAAQAVQHTAAHDASAQVRLVAGPGTGKSSAIEERVRHLLAAGVPPGRISVVSFTRASVRNLRDRIVDYCNIHQQAGGERVRVSTLHSLALRTLRAANLLAYYPADPLVLGRWEQENVFDAEYRSIHHISKDRTEEIRRDREAFWSTGQQNPPNYIPPNPPITTAERDAFTTFPDPELSAIHACCPGETIRQCLAQFNAGVLDPAQLLQIDHLIVDEFQDLNPMDIEFVDSLINRGVTAFVAGDDDQSIYSFRYAFPNGIQKFTIRFPHAASARWRTALGVRYA